MNLVAVIGAKGNMGRRYVSILNFLDVDHVDYDVDDNVDLAGVTHVIIATPTSTHIEVLEDLMPRKKIKILIEKPIAVLDQIHPMTALMPVRNMISQGHDVFMVNNYTYMHGQNYGDYGKTLFDYYNSGNDGLAWDCIQLIHLARSEIILKNDCPKWSCYINGMRMDAKNIDYSYIRMIEDFVGKGKKLWGWNDIRDAHQKTFRWQKDYDRRAGEKRVNAAQG